MRNIAIITARSGSKGLKDKNIKELNGKPLIAYSIDAAKKTGLFHEIMVSTDSTEYARIAKECGAEVPFLRSKATSGDRCGSWDVVKEVLNKYEERNKRFDTICLLQPTSPLRTFEDIKMGYKLMKEKEADAITSVCEAECSPIFTMQLSPQLSMFEYREYRKKIDEDLSRQEAGTYYRINGALFIRKIKYNGEKIEILSDKEFACIMEKSHSVDIDTQEDFDLAEYLLNKNVLSDCK